MESVAGSSLVGRLSGQADGPPAEPPLSAEPPLMIGERYQVIRSLGAGSSGRTLLCLDTREGRQVAIKELHFQHLENWKYLELFEREAKVLSLLDHPGIPKVFDFFQGEEESTALYIVQEFIEGTSLKQRLDSGPMLGQQEIYDFTLGLLDVLEYMHGRAPAVLHRDIKPSNLMIRPDGSAALVDFGGVCFGWRPPSVAGTTVVGTFGYMPPEQLMGQSGPTTDLYALGATLLHLATARPPNEFPFDSGRIEVPADLPVKASLVRLIEALLRPAPRDRPQTAEAARQILRDEEPETSVVVRETNVAAPRERARRSVPITSDDGPRFVDMGPPPRDLDGELKDVYRNLVNPLFPKRMMWSPTAQAGAILLYAFASVVTVGILPAVYIAAVRTRKRRYTDLFREGEFTHGSIRSVKKDVEMFSTFKYDYDVAGCNYVAFIKYATEMASFLDEGDTVPVLYDRNDPRQSCFVYR